jgi:uncharacterized protein YggE
LNAQTFSRRKLASLGAVALVATTLFAGSHPTSAQDATPSAGSTPATVSVSGVGTVSVTPDTASVQLGVTVTEDTLAAAQTAASTQMEAVIDAVKAAGVADKDIQTSTYYVSVVQNYDSNGNPSEVTSFQVQNQVNVVIRDISTVGDVLDGAVAAGANTIYGVNFYVDDSSAATSQARKLAVEDAHTRAQELAEAAGMTLGPVVSIVEGYSSGPIYGKGGGMAAESAAPSTPIQAGSSTLEVDVTVIYQLI